MFCSLYKFTDFIKLKKEETSLHVFFTLFCIHMHINDTNLVFYYLLFYHLKHFLSLNVLLAKRLLI